MEEGSRGCWDVEETMEKRTGLMVRSSSLIRGGREHKTDQKRTKKRLDTTWQPQWSPTVKELQKRGGGQTNRHPPKKKKKKGKDYMGN